MTIFIYSDESGVFDYIHNDVFVYGGLIYLGKDNRDISSRKYSRAEKCIKDKYDKDVELKASIVSKKDKSKLFRSLNNEHKFAVIINEKNVLKEIFENKKDKQRYLDYVFKIGIKRALQDLIDKKHIVADEVEYIYFFADEHTTATSGRYELKESLLNEFKYGTYNQTWDKKFPPLFPELIDLDLQYCDSKNKFLIRASDIVANKIYYKANLGLSKDLKNIKKLHIVFQP